MLNIVLADGEKEKRILQAMRERAASANQAIEVAVQAIMENVKEDGLPAVERYTRQFDHKIPYEISQEKLTEAYDRCPKELIAALEKAAANIRDYNERLLPHSEFWVSPDGGRVGRVVRGLTRVGPRRDGSLSLFCADERGTRQGGRGGGDRHGHASHRQSQ